MSSDPLPGESPPRVFVSYAHESPEHRDQVLRFASFLRAQGVEAVLDTWSTGERRDWYAWAIREMTSAEYVIVIASEQYRLVGDGSGPAGLHRGVQSEAAVLRELVYEDRDRWQPKILPVLLGDHGRDEIPRFLQPFSGSHFPVDALTVDGAGDLLRVILGQPAHPAPPVAARPSLPPGEPAVAGASGPTRRYAWLAGGSVVVVAAVLAVWASGAGRAGSSATAPISVVSMESTTKDYALPGPLDTADDRAAVIDPSAGLRDMLARNSGAAVGQLTVQLVVEGGRDTVRVTDIAIRIRKATPIPTGTYLGSISAGESDVIQMSADLDAAQPRFVLRDPPHAAYFSSRQVDLRLGERETLAMVFTASRKSYAFDLVIHFVADGEAHEQVVDDGSRLFRVTGRYEDPGRYGAILVRQPGTGFQTADSGTLCDVFADAPGCP